MTFTTQWTGAPLILVSGTLLTAARIIREPVRAFASPGVAAALGAAFAGGLVPSPLAGEVARLPSLVRGIALSAFVADSRAIDPVLLRNALRANSGRSLLAVWSAARGADVPGLMKASTTPTDLLWGADDRLITADDVTSARRLLNTDRVRCLPNCGHWPLLERPAETAEFIVTADVR